MSAERDPLQELPEDERRRFLQAAEGLKTFLPKRHLHHWARVVVECSGLYQYTMEEYQNDLDGRLTIQRVLESLPAHSLPEVERILEEIDEQFREVTIGFERPVWGWNLAGTNPNPKYFFYFRLPHAPGEDMRKGLLGLGFGRELNEILRQSQEGRS